MVSYNNYGGDSKSLFFPKKNLVRHPVAISVATDGDSTGEARESGHLVGCAKLMWFFFIFFLPLLFFKSFYLIFFYIWNSCICMFFILVFGIIFKCGFGYTLYSPFTHTFCSLHEWGPILGSELLRIIWDYIVVPQWMYFPSGHCENPN